MGILKNSSSAEDRSGGRIQGYAAISAYPWRGDRMNQHARVSSIPVHRGSRPHCSTSMSNLDQTDVGSDDAEGALQNKLQNELQRAEIVVLAGTPGVGRLAPPASTRISARLKRVGNSSRVDVGVVI